MLVEDAKDLIVELFEHFHPLHKPLQRLQGGTDSCSSISGGFPRQYNYSQISQEMVTLTSA